ncbi:MAG: DotU family type VI secretion system protein [Rhizobacter sp.]|nr:DotU family type VI secretion system protein [Burkholderiales bacterium]
MSTPANLDPFAILAGTAGAVPVGNAAPPSPGFADPSPMMGEAQLAADLPEVLSGTNPLAVAANPLLNLIPQIRVMPHHPDPAQLRNYLVEQVNLFERRAREANVSPETIIAARYALCTALDETAAKTPWGGGGQWSRHSLLVTFHNETWGGEKFYQVLARLVQDPKKHFDLIELMAVCIALGFEGRFGVVDNGRSQLDTLRRRLVEILDGARGEYPKALSLHWRGATADGKSKWGFLPLWITVGAILALLTSIFFLYYFLIADKSSGVFSAINAIRPPKSQALKPQPAAIERMAKFLKPEIREGLVTVNDETDKSVIILRGDGMFDSGSIDVKASFLPVIQRVSDALNAVSGSVLVAGHTDDVPIRGLRRFPSNFELSQARAEVVRSMIDARLVTRNRTRAQGQAASLPIESNTTPEGRSRNRRVEVTLLVSPAERNRELNSVGSPAPAPTSAGQGKQ